LRYFAVCEGSAAKCPICFEIITASDLKSVAIEKVINFAEGSRIDMSLLKHSKVHATYQLLDDRRETEKENSVTCVVELRFSSLSFAL
jgi:hypothetical protein